MVPMVHQDLGSARGKANISQGTDNALCNKNLVNRSRTWPQRPSKFKHWEGGQRSPRAGAGRMQQRQSWRQGTMRMKEAGRRGHGVLERKLAQGRERS